MKEMVYKRERVMELLHTEVKDGYRIAIMSYGMHPCAYVGIPSTHKYYGLHYDDIDIQCHWGLTFSEKSNPNMPWFTEDEKDLWWLGWDYGHCDDYAPYLDDFGFDMTWNGMELKKWTTKEILSECYNVVEQLIEAEQTNN